MEIYTSYFAKHKEEDERTAYVSIAVGNPKYPLAYKLLNLHSVKPYGVFKKYENDEYKARYFELLERRRVDVIRNEINILGKGKDKVLLLCHEKDPADCHRKLFAEWWESKTGEKIEEWGEKNELQQLSLFDII